MVQLVYTLQADLYGLIILTIIYLGFKRRLNLKNTGSRIFLWLIQANAAILILDMAMVMLDGKAGTSVYYALSGVTLLFYLMNALPCMLWMAYADYFIYQDERRLRRFALPALIPTAVIVLLSVLSPWKGYLFVVGADNVYQRGPHFWIVIVVAYSYLLFTELIIYKSRKRIRREDWLPLLFFAIPPAAAGALQSMMYGLAVLWPSLTISLLVVFIYIQSKLMNTDHLTGLFNRREFDYYLAGWPYGATKKANIAGVVLDLDSFKDTNDKYGHSIGDIALVKLGEILCASFRRNDFIARTGGDEFAVILDVEEDVQIQELVQRLEENIAAFNAQGEAPYQLSISIGFGVFCPEKYKTLSDFFSDLDSKMYEAKRAKQTASAGS
jgi:diguanylate cyclase (GGDEF)-like protein